MSIGFGEREGCGGLPHPGVSVDLRTGILRGENVETVRRTIGDLDHVFLDEAARARLDPRTLVYEVQCVFPAPEGTTGGLFFGTTFLQPGMVGDEYFMTKGHYHSIADRAEYYLTAAGRGALLLMDQQRRCRIESMQPGSLHYIPAGHAHRVANIGDEVLSFLACWPSDAGHDYETIAKLGFSARLRRVAGGPRLIEQS